MKHLKIKHRRRTKAAYPLALALVALAAAALHYPDLWLRPETIIRNQAPAQGQVIKVWMGQPDPRMRCMFNGVGYKFFPDRAGAKALVPVPEDMKPGRYRLVVEKDGLLRIKEILNAPIYVKDAKFKTTRLRIPKGKKALYRDPAAPEARMLLSAALVKQKSQQEWSGTFVYPLLGRVTTRFGTRRIINNRVTQHPGIDIAASSGTAVTASNNGTVLIARYLPLQGHTIVLDHGQGVLTAYYHMSRLETSEGKKAAKGDIIGRTGNTGISTGNHLHWGLYLHGIPVNPDDWVDTEY